MDFCDFSRSYASLSSSSEAPQEALRAQKFVILHKNPMLAVISIKSASIGSSGG